MCLGVGFGVKSRRISTNRRAEIDRIAPNRQDTRPNRPNQHESTRRSTKSSQLFTTKSAWCRHETTRRNRPTRHETPRGNLKIATKPTESRPNRRAEIDRIDRIATQSGDPPPPFSVGRAVLDPRSLNFFALHCAFLQKSCKGGREGKKVILFHRKVILFHRKVREKSEKSQRKV